MADRVTHEDRFGLLGPALNAHALGIVSEDGAPFSPAERVPRLARLTNLKERMR